MKIPRFFKTIFKTILKTGIRFVLLVFLLLINLYVCFGASYTVCDLGCDYQNITGALKGINNTNHSILINTSGDYYIRGRYTFNVTNLADSVVFFNTSDVSFDCNGSVLIGNGSGIGFELDSKNNITIRNCVAKEYQTGFFINDSYNITLSNVTAYNNSYVGIYMSDSYKNHLVLLNISRNGGAVVIDGGTILVNSTNITINHSVFHDNLGSGLALLGTKDILLNNLSVINRFVVFTYHSIYIKNSSKSIVLNTTINGSGSSNGIHIDRTTDSVFNDNIIINKSRAFYIKNSDDNVFVNNHVFGNFEAFFITFSSNTTVENNTFDVLANFPPQDYKSPGYKLSFTFNVSNIINKSDTVCSLLLNGTTHATNASPVDNSPNLIKTIVDKGQYRWNIRCYDSKNNIGQTSFRNLQTGNISNCIVPTEGMHIKSSKTFCTNESPYYFDDVGEKGVIIINSSNIILNCNKVWFLGNGSGSGLIVYNKTNVTLLRCYFVNYAVGIIFNETNSSKFLNSTGGTSNLGLILENAHNNLIYNNYLRYTKIPLVVHNSNDNLFNNNLIQYNENPVGLINSHNNTFLMNLILDNKDFGVNQTSSLDNNFTQNTFCNNSYSFNTISRTEISGNYFCLDPLTPADNSFSLSNNITFHYNASDVINQSDTTCDLVLNDVVNVSDEYIIDRNNAYINSTLVNNTYSWYINCSDSNGNKGNSTIYTLHIDSYKKYEFNITPIFVNGSVNITIRFYYNGTDQVAYEKNITSNSSVMINVTYGVYDLLFSAYDGEISVKFNGINHTGRINYYIGIDRKPLSDSGYLRTFGIITNISIGNRSATVRLNYSDINGVTEKYLYLYKCNDWDYTNRSCNGSWTKIDDFSRNTGLNYIEANVNSFSGFSLKQKQKTSDEDTGSGGSSWPINMDFECMYTYECPKGFVCMGRLCIENPTCDDGVKNQGETGVDCGGPCDPCTDNLLNGTCTDGMQNQGETGVDCGGPCDPCIDGDGASCNDKVQNQGEAGIDCGGPCDPCVKGYEQCVFDGIKNGDETGIDCGGLCPPCKVLEQPLGVLFDKEADILLRLIPLIIAGLIIGALFFIVLASREKIINTYTEYIEHKRSIGEERQKLKEYIAHALKTGQSPDKLRSVLVGVGWSPVMVNSMIDRETEKPQEEFFEFAKDDSGDLDFMTK